MDRFERVLLWAGGLFVTAILALIVVMIVDEGTEPNEGEVTDKSYHAAWTQITCSGNPVTCTTIHHPECWEIKYRNGEGERGDACLSQSRWDSTKIGDWFREDK